MDHSLDRIGDQLAREKRELHSLMVHADAVGDRNGGEFPWRPAGLRDSGLGGIDLKIVGHVAGRLFALHADHADHGLANCLVIKAHRTHEGAMWRPVKAIGRNA